MTMFKKALPVLAVAGAAFAASSARAAVPFQDHFSFSGFGTLGLTQTDSDKAEYKRDQQAGGATTRYSFDVDSNVGLQLTGTATDWLSGTVQVLGMQRAEEHITTEVEWAFVKLTPIDGLNIRGGRMALPMFAISDSRNVGYANTWVRPPNEVYGLAMFSRFEGGDISYRIPLGSTSLNATVLAGATSTSPFTGSVLEGKRLKGVNLQWELPWGSLRLGHVTTKVQLGASEDKYSFSGVGVIVDHDNVVAQAEYVERESETVPESVNAKGWYVLGGYRFGAVLPYVSYARTEPEGTTGPSNPTGTLSSEQSTASIGVRWDAFRGTSIKFQLDRVDAKNGTGVSFVNAQESGVAVGKVTVGAIAVDFVF